MASHSIPQHAVPSLLGPIHHFSYVLLLVHRSLLCSQHSFHGSLSRHSSLTVGTPQQFKKATLFFSGSTPNLSNVIPAMDHLDKFLTNSSCSPKLDHSMRVACELAKKTLNNYYSHTDMSKTYRIAMGTCPALIQPPSHGITDSPLLASDSDAPPVQNAIFREDEVA